MNDVFVPILVLIVLIGGMFFGANSLSRSQCENNVLEMGKEYRYDFVNGCRIGLDDGTFVYWKMYKVINK